jgi:hypothetical protein
VEVQDIEPLGFWNGLLINREEKENTSKSDEAVPKGKYTEKYKEGTGNFIYKSESVSGYFFSEEMNKSSEQCKPA